MQNTIIINADDFGLNSSVNKAIIESFEKGFINSTTIMANTDGFDEAVELAYKYHVEKKIGIHLNLEKDYLITSTKLWNSLFSGQDKYALKENRNKLFWVTGNKRNLIYNEWVAQILKVRKAGISITHIDSHHHIHEIWPLTKIAVDLLKEFKIPKMRILNNLNYKTKFHKKFYRNLINVYLKKEKVNISDYLGNQQETIAFLNNNHDIHNKIIEIMVHPVFNSQGKLVDKINNLESYVTFEKLRDMLSKKAE